MIETLIENTSINVTAFPGGGQLKKALSPYQAFIKLAHWLRQGVFEGIYLALSCFIHFGWIYRLIGRERTEAEAN